jgi:uroporphyrin-III C-methyltransferase/precorrin-2 dehydrogenase/sirohydrochlorin ferrochelatase
MRARRPTEVAPPRMDALARLPLFFSLNDRRAVIAGGNAAAVWKAELLSAAGATVDVYAPQACDEMCELAARPPRGAIRIHRRAWTEADLSGAAIAIGAFEDEGAAAIFCAAARASGVPVNVIDKPRFCDFAFGSIVNRSPLVIGISTDGAAPAFAQAIRAKLEALLPKSFGHWAAAAARWRDKVKASGLSFAGRRRVWQLFAEHAITRAESPPTDTDLENFLSEARGLGGAVARGCVVLVGAGPGDPELLTLRALRALQTADVILFDDLASREVLDFARREAKKMLVGKTGFGPSCTQDEINALMVDLAKRGKRVVRLKGGDPLIFGRAAEEIAACEAAGIPVTVIPGITAAQGAASALGVPLTERNRARRLQYVTGHARDGALPRDFDWRSLADPATTTAIYMPRRTLAALAEMAIAHGLDPATPAVAVLRATRPDQKIISAPIERLPLLLRDAPLDGPVLVLIGRLFAPSLARSARERIRASS